MAQKLILLASDQLTATVFGARDENVKLFLSAYPTAIRKTAMGMPF